MTDLPLLDSSPPQVTDVYEQLKSEIVQGVLRPNEALVESNLATRLGVSRTPIREALMRLGALGLIVSRNRRWYVYEHTAQEIQELYEIRAANESFAARLACVRATDEQASAIVAASIYDSVDSFESWVAANEEFHDSINVACGNSRLITVIRDSRLFHFNVRSARAYSPEERKYSMREHAAIAAAIRDRNCDLAEELVRQHVSGAAEVAKRVAP